MKKIRNMVILFVAFLLFVGLVAVGLNFWHDYSKNRIIAKRTSMELPDKNFNWRAKYTDKIPVTNWNGMDKNYRICNTKMREKDFYQKISDCQTSFKADLCLGDMIQTNLDDYVGTIYYHKSRYSPKGALFFNDNNYYVLYYNADWDFFEAECCHSEYTYTNTTVTIPTPVHLDIDPDVIDGADEIGFYELDVLFDNCSFDEFCKFYERMSPDLYEIDKEKQTITLDGYDMVANKMEDRFVTFDFKNQAVIGPDKKGKRITIRK